MRWFSFLTTLFTQNHNITFVLAITALCLGLYAFYSLNERDHRVDFWVIVINWWNYFRGSRLMFSFIILKFNCSWMCQTHIALVSLLYCFATNELAHDIRRLIGFCMAAYSVSAMALFTCLIIMTAIPNLHDLIFFSFVYKCPMCPNIQVNVICSTALLKPIE